MKYENDHGDLRLYYHDFLIIASLIYFCLLSLSLFFLLPPSHPLPMADAEVEQKGKSVKQAQLTHKCTHAPNLGVGCHLFDGGAWSVLYLVAE